MTKNKIKNENVEKNDIESEERGERAGETGRGLIYYLLF